MHPSLLLVYYVAMEFPNPLQARRERRRDKKIRELSPIVVQMIIDHADNDCLTDLTVPIGTPPRKVEPRQFSEDLASFAINGIRENRGNFLADRLEFDLEATVSASTEVVRTGTNDQDWNIQTNPDGINLVFRLVDPDPDPRPRLVISGSAV